MLASDTRLLDAWKPLFIGGALAFMYSGVLGKLGYDWWTDDNYSHGLLVPFVIAYIVCHEFDAIRSSLTRPATFLGLSLISLAGFLLLGGTLAAVLFAQRLSLVIMGAGVIVFFFGVQVLRRLVIPFLLLLLAIPIPQLIFNKIAFPLQILASKIADNGIRLLGIPVERHGNVIDILPVGSSELVSLEVVEACSGIRSLMTLITLALILGYFTREGRRHPGESLLRLLNDRDVLRTVLLMLAAVPVALVTNAARVMATGLIAFYYGRETVEGVWHDISGSIVFLSALALLLLLNVFLKKLLSSDRSDQVFEPFHIAGRSQRTYVSKRRIISLFVAVLFCGAFVNWFQYRGEVKAERKPLSEIPSLLGSWEQRNADIRFDPETEKVLRASDYVMRDYYGPGKRLNLYVGYYASQRSGATYHSPLSCLPGTGWEMTDPKLLEIVTPAGKKLMVNQYIVSQGEHQEFLIYWYQGRGRSSPSEYEDKLFTSLDSVTRRRSDGGMVRIMTPLGKDPARSLQAAVDLTAHTADKIGDYLPD